MNESTRTVALCIISHQRPREVLQAVRSARYGGFDEIVVVDSGSTPPLLPIEGTRHVRLDDNAGVSGARNVAARASGADYLTFLDDDAVFLNPDVRTAVLAAFADDSRMAALAFKIVRANGEVASHEHPFRGPPRDVNTPRASAYFVGAGFAVDRSAFLAAGGFDERFHYSTEEVDLSLELLGRGLEIKYEPTVVVEHRPSSSGRSPGGDIPAFRLRNRIITARKHLPLPIGIVHVIVWIARTFREAQRSGGVREWLGAVPAGLRADVDRRPLTWREARRAHRRGGRILW